MTRTTIVIAAALTLAVTLPAAPVNAQSIRTFVSVAGSDSNPCTITQPCRHFQAAVSATSAGGEVDALDPGAYGSFAISQAITIEGQGWSYVAPPNNGAAITVNAVSGKVNIHGVSLNGVGTINTTGIQFNSGSSLNVKDSVIRNFFGNGISFIITASSPSQLFVSNTSISDNTGNGIGINASGTGTTKGVINHVEMLNNSSSGLVAASNGQTMNVTVSDSVSADNSDGIVANSLTGQSVSIMVRNSTIANNTQTGLNALNAGSIIRVTRSTITGNLTGWASTSAVLSYGDNNIDGDNNVDTAPPCVNATSPCTAYR